MTTLLDVRMCSMLWKVPPRAAAPLVFVCRLTEGRSMWKGGCMQLVAEHVLVTRVSLSTVQSRYLIESVATTSIALADVAFSDNRVTAETSGPTALPGADKKVLDFESILPQQLLFQRDISQS